MKLTILGCGSASPTSKRNPTSQHLEIQGRSFLIDCGEGTQVQLRKYKLRIQKINHIFISHLHGDHFFGLIGLISTYHLLGRTTDLYIYGPPNLKQIIHTSLSATKTYLRYNLHFNELNFDSESLIYEDKRLLVYSFPMKHSIQSCGFLFKEKPKLRKINRKVVDSFNIPVYQLNDIKEGADYTDKSGLVIANKTLTFDPDPSKSYAYCSDTAYYPTICKTIRNASCLYHESTFINSDENLATKTKHSTSEQAARIAKEADVGQLILGHYSARYKKLDTLLNEAKSVFNETILGEDGLTITL